MDLEFKSVSEGERARTYHFTGGQVLRVEGVARVAVRPSGGHRLETTDGRKLIVNSGWLAIEIEADTWSF